MNEEEIREANINKTIVELSGHLTEALSATTASRWNSLELIGHYAYEYVEGTDGTDILHHLESAMRSIRAAFAIHSAAAQNTSRAGRT